MKVIQVGIGDFGFSWLKDVLLSHKDLEIIGVVDRNMDSLEKLKHLNGLEYVKVYSDLNDALKYLKPDFILNMTPPKIHKEINLIAFSHKIPVLSEKPISEHFSDAQEIFQKSLECHTPIMIAENYRYCQIVRTIKDILTSGEIGEIDSIKINFSRNHHMTNYHKDLEHPLLLDVTIHHMDMIRYLTGLECKTVFARSWTPKWSWYKGYSNLDLLLELQNDLHISYSGSLSSFKNETNWFGDWRIEGKEGILYFYNNTIQIIKQDSERKVTINDTFDSRVHVLNEFIRSINTNSLGETDISDNIKTQEMVDAAIRSINQSKMIIL